MTADLTDDLERFYHRSPEEQRNILGRVQKERAATKVAIYNLEMDKFLLLRERPLFSTPLEVLHSRYKLEEQINGGRRLDWPYV